MALQSQTYANSGNAYYGHPADWSKYPTLNSTIMFNSTSAVLRVAPASPDINTTIAFNGNVLAYAADIPDLGNWAQYDANHDVNIPNPYVLNAKTANISTVNVSTLNVNETNVNIINTDIINADVLHVPIIYSSTVTITANNGTEVTPSAVKFQTLNGLYGLIDATANAGDAGIGGGAISLTANGGETNATAGGINGAINLVANAGYQTLDGRRVATGGRIDITANSGKEIVSLTSAVNVNGGGVNIYSGFPTPIASVFGYTYLNATLGVSLVAGATTSGFQVPGTVYLYGTNGITLNSDVFTTNIKPYWTGVGRPADLVIQGRDVTPDGIGYVQLSNVDRLSFDNGANKAIVNLSTINGLPLSNYAYNAKPSFSTITMNPTGVIKTHFIKNSDPNIDLGISQENTTGNLILSVYPGGVGPAPIGEILMNQNGQIGFNNTVAGKGVTISGDGVTLTFETLGVPKGQIVGVSSINGSVFPPPNITNFVESFQIYVAPNGSDTTGVGSSQNPYQTIAHAITQRALLSTTTEVSIILSSGTYTGGFTLVRNTYLVGVQTGEARQPCNINGNIIMNDTTGAIGISGLDIGGTVFNTGAGASYAIYTCNISGGAGSAVTATGGSTFITYCRLTSSGAVVVSSSNTLTMRDCVVTQTGASVCISSSAACTIRYCNIISTSTSATVGALVRFNNTNPATTEISFSRLEYTSNATNVPTGNKCCIQYANSGLGVQTTSVFNCLLICEGAVAPLSGGPIVCIQVISSGVNTFFYSAQLSAGTNANRLPTAGLILNPYVAVV